MRITKLYLKYYKPLMHNSIKEITISDLSQITIFCAPNGWGKSSILRELTPFPGARPDFEKGGMKQIFLTHDKSFFELTSDFTKGPDHSFKRDSVELNLSGNTDVQYDLVEQYFGYTSSIDKLISGAYKVCDMTKAARKELIYNTYPSNISFVLDKHKKLCSRIRVANNQLKLLNERKLSLSQLIIKPEVLADYKKYKSYLEKGLNALDQDIFTYNKVIESFTSTVSKLKQHIPVDFNIEYINKHTEDLHVGFHNKFQDNYDKVVDGSKLDRVDSRLQTEIEQLLKDLECNNKEGLILKEEVDQYSAALKYDNETAITSIELSIDVHKQTIKQHPVNDKIPFVLDELDRFKTAIPQIEENLHFLKSMSIQHWTEEEYINKDNLVRDLQYKCSELAEQEHRLLYQINHYKEQLTAKSSYQFPNDCNRGCELRDSYTKIIKGITIDIENTQAELDKITTILVEQNQALSILKTEVEGHTSARLILSRLERFISSKSWGNFVCSDSSFINAVNSDITKINNNLHRLIKNSDNKIRVDKAKQELVILEAELIGLKASNQPAKQLLLKSLIEKETKLEKIIRLLDVIKINHDGKVKQKELYNLHSYLCNEIATLDKTYVLWRQLYIAETELSFIKGVVIELNTTKLQIVNKLRELDNIIKEQDSYLTRLNAEVVPNINGLKYRIKKWTMIADKISPITGIPYLYTVRYLNIIFKLANKFIRRVWDYDIELMYFTEEPDPDFDFIFKLKINQSSEIKDVSMCSKGQKTIVNLAVSLAIAIYRQYATTYPIRLDEIDDGLTPSHRDKLTEFLGELLHQKGIMQTFIVNHYVAVSSGFGDAGIVSLSDEEVLPSQCVIKAKIQK